MLPKQTRRTFGKHITKPSEQVAAPDRTIAMKTRLQAGKAYHPGTKGVETLSSTQVSFSHVCDSSIMEQVEPCAVWPTQKSWLGSSKNQIHGWRGQKLTFLWSLDERLQDGKPEFKVMRYFQV